MGSNLTTIADLSKLEGVPNKVVLDDILWCQKLQLCLLAKVKQSRNITLVFLMISYKSVFKCLWMTEVM